MASEQKVEFIAGEVLMHSTARNHPLSVAKRLLLLLEVWVEKRKLGLIQAEKALCAFSRNDYEPDIAFWGRDKSASIQPNTMKFRIPDFIAEALSESTEKNDRGIKFEDYAAHGVAEYWIIDTDNNSVEQYQLDKSGNYQLVKNSQDGQLRSSVINGFDIPIQAGFDSEINQTTLRKMML
jgi:Uma2 family endonuclease